MMRANGFTWSTNRVAQIETLHRPVSLLEVVGLSAVFFVPVSRLLAGDDEIDLPSGDTWPLSVVREALAGPVNGVGPVEIHAATKQELEDYRASGEDLRKMAAKLGLRTEDLDALAYRVFGQSFRAEREARTGDVSSLTKRSAQTKRGHVSRALLAAIEDHLGDDAQRGKVLAALHKEVDEGLRAVRASASGKGIK